MALTLLVLSACSQPPAQSPVPEGPREPVAVEIPPPPAPRPEVFSLPSNIAETHYRLESKTVLVRDSAGRRESQELTSRAQSTLRLRRFPDGRFEGSGMLTAYQVSSAFSTVPVAVDSLRFDAALDTLSLRVVSRPPLANECDRAETGALGLVRDVLIRLPTSVTVGERWQDSTVQVVCRSGVPMVVRTSSAYVVTGSERDGEQQILLVRRTSVSNVSGATTSPWRSVGVAGTGEGTLEARVLVGTGVVQRVRGTSMLTLTVSDRSVPSQIRSQQVTQRVTLSADVIK